MNHLLWTMRMMLLGFKLVHPFFSRFMILQVFTRRAGRAGTIVLMRMDGRLFLRKMRKVCIVIGGMRNMRKGSTGTGNMRTLVNQVMRLLLLRGGGGLDCSTGNRSPNGSSFACTVGVRAVRN
jgi:hypothetical protein